MNNVYFCVIKLHGIWVVSEPCVLIESNDQGVTLELIKDGFDFFEDNQIHVDSSHVFSDRGMAYSFKFKTKQGVI